MTPWLTRSKVYRVPFALIKAPHVTFAPILTFALEQFLVIGTLIKTGSISSMSTSGRATAKCNLHECCVQRFWFFRQSKESPVNVSPISSSFKSGSKSARFSNVEVVIHWLCVFRRVNHVVTRGKWAYTQIRGRHNGLVRHCIIRVCFTLIITCREKCTLTRSVRSKSASPWKLVSMTSSSRVTL